MAVAVPAFVGITLTLAATPATNLLAALQAVDSRLAGVLQNCATLAIQADLANGANAVAIGDSNVSLVRRGYDLLPHDQFEYPGGPAMNVPLGAIWLIPAIGSLVVNVQVTF